MKSRRRPYIWEWAGLFALIHLALSLTVQVSWLYGGLWVGPALGMSEEGYWQIMALLARIGLLPLGLLPQVSPASGGHVHVLNSVVVGALGAGCLALVRRVARRDQGRERQRR